MNSCLQSINATGIKKLRTVTQITASLPKVQNIWYSLPLECSLFPSNPAYEYHNPDFCLYRNSAHSPRKISSHGPYLISECPKSFQKTMLLKNVVLLCASVSSALAATHSAIDYLWPAPQSVVDLNQSVAIKSFTVANLEFTDDPSIVYAFRQLNKSLAAKKASGTGSAAFPITVKITGKKVAGPAQLDGADESYSIKATSKGVVISAATQVGVVYGFQTLSQLVTADGQLVLANINDAPRFSYRGLLLDTGRNFFPKEDILRLLDGMVYSKLNVFHW
ncbi:hypothetical protein BDR26DRAFT_970042 [Obelidium mucronatum]|nr:hypothetical protein BDR26DRAFT_970042 [Obelidium mucronatum]